MVRFSLRFQAGMILAVGVLLAGGISPSSGEETGGTADLGVDITELSPVVDNPYAAFDSLRRAVYTGRDRDPDTGKTSKVRMEVTVRDTTMMLAGAKVTVVDITDYQDGEAVEQTRSYYAQHRTGVVYYLGEHVDDLAGGKIVGHEGQWVAGEKGNRAGVFMPAAPRVGDVFEPERAPGVAQSRSKVLAVGRTVKVAAGAFANCVETEEYDPIEKTTRRRVYCSGVGLVKESSADRTIELASRESR